MLDFAIHPRDLALYLHSTMHIGLGLRDVPSMTYWLVQLAVVAVLLAAYALRARRLHVPARSIAASCGLVLGWQVVLIPST